MIENPVLAAKEKYKRHSSILKIKKLIRNEHYFHFNDIDDKMAEVIKNLNAKTVKREKDVPIKLIKENIDLFSLVLS